MTSKERLTAALNFQESDTVPFDLGATTVSSIARTAYVNAMQARNLPAEYDDMDLFDPVQQIVQPVEESRLALGIDTHRVGAPRLAGSEVSWPSEKNGIFSLVDQFRCDWEFNPASDFYYNLASSPLDPSKPLTDELKAYEFPKIRDAEDELERVVAPQFETAGYRGIVADRNCAGITEVAFRLRGYEQFFMDLALDPSGSVELMEKIIEYKQDYWIWFASLAEKLGKTDEIMVAVECDDLGTQDSLLCSPDMIRSMIMPLQAGLVKHIKTLLPNVKVLYHSDGAIFDLIPDFIEMGVDILNPVQFTASGMELSKLKSTFGKDIVFWGGGVDTQETLPHGTPEQVADEVKRNIDILAPGGGFVFAAVHNIQADVAPENFWALWDVVKNN